MKLNKTNKNSKIDFFSSSAPRRCVCKGFCSSNCSITALDENRFNQAVQANLESVSDRYSIANTVSVQSL